MSVLFWQFSNPSKCIYPNYKCVLNKLNKPVKKKLTINLKIPTVLQGEGAEGLGALHLKFN